MQPRRQAGKSLRWFGRVRPALLSERHRMANSGSAQGSGSNDKRLEPIRQPAGILISVDAKNLITEIVATYQRHGWTLRQALLTSETKAAVGSTTELAAAQVRDSDFDALWFSRSSHQTREAWELRLVSEQAYALFEVFEADETEEDRDDARLEMENRMRGHVKG